MSYNSILGQSSMALDKTRNKIYQKALKDTVTNETVVLDLGAGMAPFGLIAAKLGAKKVYLVEPQPMINTVKNVVASNNLQAKVECIQGTIEKVELPEKVDIITSCFTGNFLLSEDLLPSLFYARDNFLKSGGVLLPSSGSMYATPLSIPKIFKNRIEIFSELHLGIDYSFYRKHAANTFYRQRNIAPDRYLARPQLVHTIDFNRENTAECDNTITFKIARDAECHGFIGWFDMQLGKHTLSTALDAPLIHWSPLWFPTDPPIKVTAGEDLIIRIKKPQYKPWSWSLTYQDSKQAHSAFVMNMAEMNKSGMQPAAEKTG